MKMRDYIDNGFESGDRKFDRKDLPKIPAFQLNKFQSEFNLSFNQEMAKMLADALLNNEDTIQNRGRNIPPPLFSLLTKLEDMQKNRFFDDREGFDRDDRDHRESNNRQERECSPR